MKRELSWDVLADLTSSFDEATASHVFECDEEREMCYFDYVEQYQYGYDPQPRYL